MGSGQLKVNCLIDKVSLGSAAPGRDHTVYVTAGSSYFRVELELRISGKTRAEQIMTDVRKELLRLFSLGTLPLPLSGYGDEPVDLVLTGQTVTT